ncbi:uncharacterized protein LOC110499580 [Oncorhynchus mykiss]|uniref:uncharacterized protein LOC110499580 n=1 Tax=Oncorhynchus mykiss TaxID=8022 RepID=UPI000B4EA127|nr:uncharacterized protein LOC110499580 [Oncorhynchus mykiss]
MDALMACLVAMCLCLVLPVSWSQSTHKSEEFINTQPQPAPGVLPQLAPAAAHIQDVLKSKEETEITSKQMYANVGHDNAKLGLFIAAALGIVALMGMVYCIYMQFYTKHQYLHTQLHDDSELTLDLPEAPPVFFHGSVGAMDRKGEVRGSGNGSFISNTPSTISVPPRLSPPPSAVPYLPLFLASYPLRTISVRDLERSFV